MRINLTLRRFVATIVTVENAIIITYYECVLVALVMQHAMRMRLIVVCGLRGSTMYFFHIVLKGTILIKWGPD